MCFHVTELGNVKTVTVVEVTQSEIRQKLRKTTFSGISAEPNHVGFFSICGKNFTYPKKKALGIKTTMTILVSE